MTKKSDTCPQCQGRQRINPHVWWGNPDITIWDCCPCTGHPRKR